MIDESAIRLRFEALKPVLDERWRRRFAAAEARAAGFGGIQAVAQITGIARSTIGRGLAELCGATDVPPAGRVRRPGAGRKPLTETDPILLDDLRALVEPATRGDPERPLLWTAKSLRNLAGGLQELGHRISFNSVRSLLGVLGYSLQANRKTREGTNHPDRDAQFGYINNPVKAALAADEPVISVDTKKKELVGDFKNAGREWCPKGSRRKCGSTTSSSAEGPRRALRHLRHRRERRLGQRRHRPRHRQLRRRFDPSLVALMGAARYPKAKHLTITADGGGSNGARLRLWKVELQKLADELGLSITVCHLPPGTSKWNKIEHRLFSFITQNWRGKPLVSHQVIVQLIAATATKTGLKVRSEIDPNSYPAGIKIAAADLARVNLRAMNSTATGTTASIQVTCRDNSSTSP